jgi:Tol biopolymer transport system component
MNRYQSSLIALILITAAAAGVRAEILITSPSPDQPVYSGEITTLALRWTGEPAGIDFRWSSDIEGELGLGLNTTAVFSYATHQVTVAAVRADTVIATATTTVHVLSTPEQFTLSPRIDWEGEFSRDGSRVAYTSFRSGDPEVWVADMENRLAERITYNGGRTPVWNPGGTALVFWSERSGSRDLWLVELGRLPREALRLTGAAAEEWMPAFHPAEMQIAYIAKQANELRLMLLTLGPEDTTAAELVGPEHYPMFPRWNGTGDKLLFTSFSAPEPVLTSYDPATGAMVQIGPPGCEDADISADGSNILLVREDELYLMDAITGLLRPLTHQSGGVLSPRFSPDGSMAVFATTRSGNHDLWLLNLPPER